MWCPSRLTEEIAAIHATNTRDGDMTTTREAIERLTEATGLPSATVTYAARFLAEANTALWPKGGRGGGKNAAHVDVRHLTNLILGIYGGEQVKDAAETVRAFSSLVLLRDVTTLMVRKDRYGRGLFPSVVRGPVTIYPATVKEIGPGGIVKELPPISFDGTPEPEIHAMAQVRGVMSMLWVLGTVKTTLKHVRVRRDMPEIEVTFEKTMTTRLDDGTDEENILVSSYTYGREDESKTPAPFAGAKIISELPPELFSVIAELHPGASERSDGGDLFSTDNVDQQGTADETSSQTEMSRSVGADRLESDNTNRNSLAINVPRSKEQDSEGEGENQSESESESENDSQAPVSAVGGQRFISEPVPTLRIQNDARSYRPAHAPARSG